MLQRIAAALLIAFLLAIGVNWPELPLNARLADLIFLPLAGAVVALGVRPLTWRSSDTAVVIYLLGALPAIAVSADRRHSAIEFVREIYLVAIYMIAAIAARRGMARTAATGLASSGAMWSIAGVAFVVGYALLRVMWAPMGEVMQLPYLGATLRLRALTASEAMFACVLTAAVPFAVVKCSSRVSGWCVAAAAMVAAAMLTLSHAFAGFAVAALIASWPSLNRRARPLAVACVVTIVVALNVAAAFSITSLSYGTATYSDPSRYHHAVDHRERSFGRLHIAYNVMSYFRIKQVAWSAFTEHPVAGVGLDQFHTETRRAFDDGRLTSTYREIDPHSTLPGRLAECGLIGGVSLLVLWFAWARMAAAQARRSAAGLAAAAALAGLAVASINADIMNFRFLWVIAGLLRGLQDASGIAIDSGRTVDEIDGGD